MRTSVLWDLKAPTWYGLMVMMENRGVTAFWGVQVEVTMGLNTVAREIVCCGIAILFIRTLVWKLAPSKHHALFRDQVPKYHNRIVTTK
jgi:hypothetical protein